MPKSRTKQPKSVKTLPHKGDTRANNPTAELEELVREDEASPRRVTHPRKNNPDETPELYARNADLDPQLVWRGKDAEDREPLAVDALPIYVQEHIHPKAIIDDLRRRAEKGKVEAGEETADLFGEWAGELSPEDRVEFYQHQQKWTNRMILGDGLLVMTSLAEKENLRGQVQCIYFDPPYGIRFGSNWQASTKSTSVGENELSREPEAIKAFRDTWKHGVNSYLSYLRDRITVARELLHTSGSIFVQIGDENVHLVRTMLDEIFGRDNFISMISFQKTGYLGGNFLDSVYDHILWFAKNKQEVKFRRLNVEREQKTMSRYNYVQTKNGIDLKLNTDQINGRSPIPYGKRWQDKSLFSDGATKGESSLPFMFRGREFKPIQGKHWSTGVTGLGRAEKADRIVLFKDRLRLKSYAEDFPVVPMGTIWTGTMVGRKLNYVVETAERVVERCLLMTTDPGDLVIDPTCGSGTTAYVAEQWGRRWITTDTSRVSLALARARLMGSHFDWYLLNDSEEGAKKEMAVSGNDISRKAYGNNVREGFVLERTPHITLSVIANNAEIDSIWERHQPELLDLQAMIAKSANGGDMMEEWEIPKEADPKWPAPAKEAHAKFLEKRMERQREIDESIGRNADIEYLHDRPYKQSGVVRVTGPFTVESLSPHRIVPSDAEDEAIMSALKDEGKVDIPENASRRLRPASERNGETRFHDVVFENLRKAGVHNTKKGEDIEFTSLEPWPKGKYIQFEGRYLEKGKGKEIKAAICIGPEYGTVPRSLLVRAAREAADYFDLLIVMGFSFEAYADDELMNIGRMRVLRARMNNDLHMGERLQTGGGNNLFVLFGEPDIALRKHDGNMLEVEIKGVDIFDPTTGVVRSANAKEIACWFIDTDYNEEAFFVRHAYFSDGGPDSSGGSPDPYKRLRRTLKAEIDEDAWAELYSTTSRPFRRPESGRIAVKAINHYGDEVLRVFDV